MRELLKVRIIPVMASNGVHAMRQRDHILRSFQSFKMRVVFNKFKK